MRQVYLPETFEEVWGILDRDKRARIYAGGTDLLGQLRHGLIQTDCLICVERVAELQGVREEGAQISIGAGCTHSSILGDTLISRHLPVLARALGTLGSPPIRHMGTIGGNIVNASPAGDTLPPLFVLEARLVLRSKDESRTIPIADFIEGPGITGIRRGELLPRVVVPKAPAFRIHHFEKVGRRKAQACAIASLAAVASISQTGIVEEIRLAWGSVGPTVIRAQEVEKALQGKPLNREALAAVIPLVDQAISPIEDARAGAEYRRIVAGNLLIRLSQYWDDYRVTSTLGGME